MAVDWRLLVRLNKRRTRYALATFILIYFCLGFVTALIFSTVLPVSKWWLLLMQEDTQVIISIFLVVSFITIIIAVLLGGRLSLAGNERETYLCR